MTDQELLDSIEPGKVYSWKSVYFHDLDNPGFAETFMKRLELVGYDPNEAMRQYQAKVDEYEAWYKEQCRPAAEWLLRQINEEQERRERKVKAYWKEMERLKNTPDRELMQSLTQLYNVDW